MCVVALGLFPVHACASPAVLAHFQFSLKRRDSDSASRFACHRRPPHPPGRWIVFFIFIFIYISVGHTLAKQTQTHARLRSPLSSRTNTQCHARAARTAWESSQRTGHLYVFIRFVSSCSIGRRSRRLAEGEGGAGRSHLCPDCGGRLRCARTGTGAREAT